jgi:hypothetical protein
MLDVLFSLNGKDSQLVSEISFVVSLLSLWGASLILNGWSLIGKGTWIGFFDSVKASLSLALFCFSFFFFLLFRVGFLALLSAGRF